MTENIPSLENLLAQLPLIEEQSLSDALVIYTPDKETAGFYHNLCRFYLAASPNQRSSIRNSVEDKPGIIDNLLGFVFQCAESLKETHHRDWLKIGLAAASIHGNRPDFRDFYLALTELYVTALEAGIDPKGEFNAIKGGVPKDFHTFAVLKERLARIQKT